jgi:tetraacyldisaccharide 4'-kinase
LNAVIRAWQGITPLSIALLPLSGLFWLLLQLRLGLYRIGLLRSDRLPVPVLVVGNISVGGSGKSPLVIWLAQRLSERGFRVGILSRGYGGKGTTWPCAVQPDSDPALVGDEPVMIAQASGCPLFVGPDRLAAGRALLEQHPCDLLLCDDGLQHYRLERDLEIAVIDGQRRHGNGFLLPAGPLREPVSRLDRVQWRVAKGRAAPGEILMQVHLGQAVSLIDPGRRRPLDSFRGQPLHALAGIGHPASFFELLRAQGLELIEHPRADHQPFRPGELDFGDERPVLMTWKDAVKCRHLADERHWYLPLEAELPQAFLDEVVEGLAALMKSLCSP